MNVLSLFDGISCGRVAMERCGIKVDNYFSSEIDKYAIQVSQKNYPDIIRLGDIQNWRSWDLPKIDLLLGGSPCQGFSVAGKHLNFEDPRSKLFFEFAKCKVEFNPDYFLLENVMMKQEYQKIVSDYLGVKPTHLNSEDFSPQLRSRLYWTNWPILPVDPTIPNLDFQDILESDTARIKKAYALTATYHKKGAEPTRQRNFKRCQRPIAWIDDNNTRWLTPLECERLQMLPENYTAGVSNTQRYRSIGNGWNIATIEHIFNSLPEHFFYKEYL